MSDLLQAKSKNLAQEQPSQSPGWTRRLKPAMAYCLLSGVLVVAAFFAPDANLGTSINLLWLIALSSASIFVLPSRWTAMVVPPCIFALWWILTQATAVKIALTNFPLMALDVRLFFADPNGLLDSIRAPRIAYWAFFAIPPILGLAALYVLYKSHKHGRLKSLVAKGPQVLGKLVLVALAIFSLYHASVVPITKFAKTHGDDMSIWSDEGLVKFAKTLGVVPVLLYSQYIDGDGARNFLTYIPSAPAPSPDKLLESAAKYLNFPVIKSRPLPNIMIIHAESTFDPNDVFKLAAPVENSLFYSVPLKTPDPKMQMRGPGLANVIGGGSWVSEFEVVNGIDSRLFGISGRYTHASLSGYSHHSLVRYLADRGYHSGVYTRDSPLFYNSGVAYKKYGFERFHGNIGD